MQSKQNAFILSSLVLALLIIVGCSKTNSTPKTVAVSGIYWYGNIIGTNNFFGPGNGILLRTDGTMREYANDYYSGGTTMGPGDTGTAKIKLDGTYSTTTVNGAETVNTTWYQPAGATTYYTSGLVSGNTMSGTFRDTAAAGYTVANFKFTNGN